MKASIRAPILLALLFLCGAWPGEPAAQADWKLIEVPESVFSFRMPGSPSVTVEKTDQATAEEITTRTYSGRHPSRAAAYEAVIWTFPAEVKEPRTFLQKFSAHLAADFPAGKWDAIRFLKKDGLVALEARGLSEKRQPIRAYQVVKGREAIALLVEGKDAPALAAAYFRTLEVTR